MATDTEKTNKKIRARKSYKMYKKFYDAGARQCVLELLHSELDNRRSYGSERASNYSKESLDLLLEDKGIKQKWIDEGCEGEPKTYTDRTKVLELIRSLLREDESLLEVEAYKDVDKVSDSDLFTIGFNHYSISII